jgi:diguanylate cyclase (GGDEF)-like protein
VYVPAFVLAVVAAMAVRGAFSETTEASLRLEHSHEVIARAQRLAAAVAQAQSSMRGFVITGADDFLTPYAQADQEVAETRAKLLELLRDRPTQLARVRRAVDLYVDWQQHAAEPAILARRQQLMFGTGASPSGPTPEQLVSSRQGKRRIDEFHQVLGELVEEEERVLEVRRRESRSASAYGSLLALWGPLVALGVALLVTLAVALRTARVVEAVSQAATDLSAGNLERRVEVHGSGELGDLARAFNGMASHLAHKAGESYALSELGELLQASLNVPEVYTLFDRAVAQLLPGATGCVYLFNASRNLLVRATDPSEGARVFEPEGCWALRQGRPHLCEGNDPLRCKHLDATDARDAICLPMNAQGETLGLVELSWDGQTPSREEMVRVGETLAERFGVTLANLKLRDRLRDQSIRDPLTGLFNRRYLEETFSRELERARRSQRPIGVLVLDVDHFKRLNDSQGHEAGDAILQELGKVLQSSFRTSDVACRFGGEEFVVVLPEATLEQAVERAERVRVKVSEMKVSRNGRTIGPVTASFGVSAAPEDGTTAQELLRAADLALYRAKANGRDRVVPSRELTSGSEKARGSAVRQTTA